MNNWFEIGVIVKPQGVRGEVRVLPTTDNPEQFALLQEVHVRQDNKTVSYKIESVRPHKGLVLMQFAGVSSRNAAECLIGGVLIIPPDKAVPLDANEYFIRDLIGLNVETECGNALGKITDVFPTGANDVYVVQDHDGQSFMLPAIKDVILSVSIPDGKMTVRLLEGLKELTV